MPKSLFCTASLFELPTHPVENLPHVFKKRYTYLKSPYTSLREIHVSKKMLCLLLSLLIKCIFIMNYATIMSNVQFYLDLIWLYFNRNIYGNEIINELLILFGNLFHLNYINSLHFSWWIMKQQCSILRGFNIDINIFGNETKIWNAFYMEALEVCMYTKICWEILCCVFSESSIASHPKYFHVDFVLKFVMKIFLYFSYDFECI